MTLEANVVCVLKRGGLVLEISKLKSVLSGSTETRQFRAGVNRFQTIYGKVTYDPVSHAIRIALSPTPREGFYFCPMSGDDAVLVDMVNVPHGDYHVTSCVALGSIILLSLRL